MEKMKLLELLSKKRILPEDVCGRTVIMHVNHCMENSYAFSRLLGNIFWKVVFIGIPYNHLRPPEDPAFSAYGAVEKETQRYMLFRRNEMAGEFEGDLPGCVRKLIRRALEEEILPLLEEGCRLLILEDGGYHYEVILDLEKQYPALAEQILGVVEQTNYGTVRGLQICETEGYRYPLMSVSRSEIKMNVESLFIAQRVVEELSMYLYSANSFLNFHRVLLVGYGVIGRRIAQILKRHFTDLTVYDKDPWIRSTAVEEGFSVCEDIQPEFFSSDTILIGSTGHMSFNEEMLISFLEGSAERLYLVSSSSQEVEFLILLSMLRKERPFPDGVKCTGHRAGDGLDQYFFHFTGPDGQEKEKEICLIAKGRPVNFYRQNVISLTDCMIDLVFSEILLLAIWLCRHPDAEKKLFLFGEKGGPFEPEYERKMFRRWLELYDLSEEAGMRALHDAHPAQERLRGEWKR